jgi:hypothetical protein
MGPNRAPTLIEIVIHDDEQTTIYVYGARHQKQKRDGLENDSQFASLYVL